MSRAEAHANVWKRSLLALAVVMALVVALILGSAINNYRLMPESYAAWTTGNLMVEYLQTHANQWPRSWEDLRSAKESYKGVVYTEFEMLPKFVKIDWKVDVTRLIQATTNEVHVVTRPDGSNVRAIWGTDTEPNTKIMRYLKDTGAANPPDPSTHSERD